MAKEETMELYGWRNRATCKLALQTYFKIRNKFDDCASKGMTYKQAQESTVAYLKDIVQELFNELIYAADRTKYPNLAIDLFITSPPDGLDIDYQGLASWVDELEYKEFLVYHGHGSKSKRSAKRTVKGSTASKSVKSSKAGKTTVKRTK